MSPAMNRSRPDQFSAVEIDVRRSEYVVNVLGNIQYARSWDMRKPRIVGRIVIAAGDIHDADD